MFATAVRRCAAKEGGGDLVGKVANVLKQTLAVNPKHSSPYLHPDEYRKVADLKTSEKYLVGPNMPLKQEPLSKGDFHYWDRASRVRQSHTFVVDASAKDTATGEGAYYVRNSQIAQETYRRLGMDMSRAEDELPPVPPRMRETDLMMLDLVAANNKHPDA